MTQSPWANTGQTPTPMLHINEPGAEAAVARGEQVLLSPAPTPAPTPTATIWDDEAVARGEQVLITPPPAPERFSAAHGASKIFKPVAGHDICLAGNDSPIPSHKAITQDYGTRLLGIVGRDYQIVQTADIINAHEIAIEAALTPDQLQNVQITDTTARGGAFTKREYVFQDVVARISELPRGNYPASTDTMLRSSIYTTHDGSGSACSAWSSIDGFCTNSLLFSKMDIFRRKHTSGFTMPKEQFAAHATAAIDRWRESIALMSAWAKNAITDQQAQDALKAMPGISERRRKHLQMQFDVEASRRGATMWALASALTYFASHDEGNFSVRSTKQDHVAETLTKREQQVMVWLNNPAFLALANH